MTTQSFLKDSHFWIDESKFSHIWGDTLCCILAIVKGAFMMTKNQKAQTLSSSKVKDSWCVKPFLSHLCLVSCAEGCVCPLPLLCLRGYFQRNYALIWFHSYYAPNTSLINENMKYSLYLPCVSPCTQIMHLLTGKLEMDTDWMHSCHLNRSPYLWERVSAQADNIEESHYLSHNGTVVMMKGMHPFAKRSLTNWLLLK